MRIALVYDAVYPWEKGGAQKRVWELARRLAPDHDVHLYGMHYWDGPAVVKREAHSVREVVEHTAAALGEEITIQQDETRTREHDRPHLQADVSRLTAETSWEPTVTLTEGLRELVPR